MARLVGVALALLLLAVLIPRSAHSDETQSIGRIEITPGTRSAFPAADALWQPHALPMRWSSSGGRAGIWLRYSFSLKAAPQDEAGMGLRAIMRGG